ncbi:HAMP domain-containing histidine kinase, partial [candidate division WWE3 bacterium]|nr:HAMP domain-containing histidine kinase [candidate division WWE3 bacterium]
YHLQDDIEKVHEDKTQYRKTQIVKEKFISTASHHLRTPLTIIKGYAELLNDPNIAEEDKTKARKNILTHTTELETLTEKLIHLASIQSIAEHLQLRSQTIVSTLDTLAKRFSKHAKRKHIDFRYVVDASVMDAQLEFDSEQLQIAIGNLIANAIKYTNEGGVVTLKANASDTHVYILISDNGKGIPQEDIGNLFSSFYHAGSPLDAQEGAGIGLFVTKEIIKAHNGDIAVESKVGKGTVFTIKLPRNSIHQLLENL